jgi:hypothetical protein
MTSYFVPYSGGKDLAKLVSLLHPIPPHVSLDLAKVGRPC